MPSELFAVSHPQAGSSCDSPRFGVGYCSFKRPPPPPPSSPSVCCARNHFPTLSPILVSPWPTYLDRRPQKPSRSGAIPPFGRAGVRVWRRIWRAGKLTLLLLAMNTTGRSAADPTLFPNAHIVSTTFVGCSHSFRNSVVRCDWVSIVRKVWARLRHAPDPESRSARRERPGGNNVETQHVYYFESSRHSRIMAGVVCLDSCSVSIWSLNLHSVHHSLCFF
ncbi:hypothetical protein IWX90DRAFT_275391 [Phyllosticta citrichinensis]|uniref:Uncharacterized protein n=1 Tax=Phyllosticta citrichinensis TaxID=1130410 RepID=A0ABR1XN49_9PEZI